MVDWREYLRIGGRYPYREGAQDTPRRLVTEMKRVLDPNGRLDASGAAGGYTN